LASVMVDGLVIPVALAGHPALDFCNTRAGWGSPAPKEYLVSYPHLAVWARENGLVTAAGSGQPSGAAVLARAVAFRDGLYAVLTGAARPADWAAVNTEVRRAASALALRPGAPATWCLSGSVGADLPLLAVAWAAAALLTSPAASTVAACPGRGCGWLFADPRGRRRWCSMALCGNRAKARRYAHRVKDGGTAPPAVPSNPV